jgi:DNA-binding winged helix-turn-helix (wHTH) protein
LPRYRFGAFTLSPRRRTLVQAGRELRLIPRYFDLLVFLVERRHEAVHRRDIFDRVWADVVVSDTALSQAIRTLRRTLGDDPRDPRFIRTVSRHGYQFVCPDVAEEDDSGPALPALAALPTGSGDEPHAHGEPADPFEPLLQRIARLPSSGIEEEDQRDAAERLHALGTSQALERLGVRAHHEHARAVLRDTRWEAQGSGDVPILGAPGAAATALALVRLRLRRTARVVAVRWLGAVAGGAAAGLSAGFVGGVLLVNAPQSAAPATVIPVLAALGAAIGAVAAAGVGIGISVPEAAWRSRRLLAVAAGGASGGAIVGCAVQFLSRSALAALVGVHVAVGGCIEGVVLGAAAGLGFAIGTRRIEGGLAAPRGAGRLTAAALTSGACALGALALALADRPLAGGTVHAIAQAASSSQALLTPLGRLIGEPDFGAITRAVIATGEGAVFGAGLALGLTRRRR